MKREDTAQEVSSLSTAQPALNLSSGNTVWLQTAAVKQLLYISQLSAESTSEHFHIACATPHSPQPPPDACRRSGCGPPSSPTSLNFLSRLASDAATTL